MYRAQRSKYGRAKGPKLIEFLQKQYKKTLHLLNILLDKLYITGINLHEQCIMNEYYSDQESRATGYS